MEMQILEELRALRAKVEELERKKPTADVSLIQPTIRETNLTKVSRYLVKNSNVFVTSDELATKLGLVNAKEVLRAVRKFQSAAACGVPLASVNASFSNKYVHLYASLRQKGGNKTEFDYAVSYGRCAKKTVVPAGFYEV